MNLFELWSSIKEQEFLSTLWKYLLPIYNEQEDLFEKKFSSFVAHEFKMKLLFVVEKLRKWNYLETNRNISSFLISFSFLFIIYTGSWRFKEFLYPKSALKTNCNQFKWKIDLETISIRDVLDLEIVSNQEFFAILIQYT